MSDTSIDPAEVAKFEAMAQDWWDPDGAARPLHAMNPCRLDYIADQIAGEFARDRAASRPFEGLSVLDVGCGGGLLCEPLARLGAAVTGIDAAAGNVAAARAHAEMSGLSIQYRAITAEALAAEGRRFDVVLAMEIVEHVADPATFLADLARLVRPGGLLVASTLNRTGKSFAAAIVGAEWILRWLPRGTHDWRRFLTPDELEGLMAAGGLDPVDRKGMVPDIVAGTWRLSPRDLSVNYVVTALRR
ncbi:bifunctional 2-polyprenyl-6-hydroxyphenol methylase/3-demethylubiquinol 3-O-methyltransferase UbiG [Roseivivax isoporae]|uniref:Ubiquinone biosynthesis O-methyltransferase n=1 Tax=Roseivivax isoporae LMG 25204 TaxID=1449351 RepID=X7F578_9RHOB|nr:bifunctional 2-polyprenyl-6-hydroxyphenol methylase/3-demethylubiquinol 3-O-methyltransferase UbiG [Roseivivax isoporae]ETX27898.1 3-demethylubiquinone-9 3-methyltransferase [Roseivivax isoporae LMG 25204]